MKKFFPLFILFGIMSFEAPAYSQTADVREVIKSSITVSMITISSYSATQVDSSSIVMSQRNFVALQNTDLDYNVWCSEKNTITIGNGFVVPKGYGSIEIPITYGRTGYAPAPAYVPTIRLTLYCISENPASTGKLAVIQGY